MCPKQKQQLITVAVFFVSALMCRRQTRSDRILFRFRQNFTKIFQNLLTCANIGVILMLALTFYA